MKLLLRESQPTRCCHCDKETLRRIHEVACELGNAAKYTWHREPWQPPTSTLTMIGSPARTLLKLVDRPYPPLPPCLEQFSRLQQSWGNTQASSRYKSKLGPCRPKLHVAVAAARQLYCIKSTFRPQQKPGRTAVRTVRPKPPMGIGISGISLGSSDRG